MPKPGRSWLLAVAAVSWPATNAIAATPSGASQPIAAIPEQTSHIRLSNHDVNHIVCIGGDVDDVKFSAEKGLAVERGGADAWVKFLVKETEELGVVTRAYVTSPSEFFVTCNGSVYPLYAEPSDIAAQTVTLIPGAPQKARANEALLGPLVEEERAISITLALLQDRVPASFTEVAPRQGALLLADLPGVAATERRRLAVEGSGLSASEYLLSTAAATTLDERALLDPALGPDIFAVTLDRLAIAAGQSARLVIVRRGQVQ